MRLLFASLVCLLLFPLSIAAAENETTADGLAFEDAHLQCFDGEVEIGIYVDGAVPEGDLGLSLSELGRHNHQIKIRRGQDILVYDKNVIGVTDGAGNDTFEVLLVTNPWKGLEEVVSLFYDHELGYLEGFYSRPSEDEWGQRVYNKVALVGDSMNCYDYTYGD